MKMHLTLASVAALTLATAAGAAPLYMVGGAGIVRSFDTGASLEGAMFADGTQVANIPAYGSYQDFTMNADGAIIGVTQDGAVEQWDDLATWLANGSSTIISSGNVFAANGQPGSLHGFSYDATTGGYFATREDAGAADGDGVIFASLADFTTGIGGGTIVEAPYGGNLLNIYYPDEDVPGNRNAGPSANEPGSNYLQIAGSGQLEGWLTLTGASDGYLTNPDNRSFEAPGFGPGVGAGFAVVAVPEPVSLGAFAVGALTLLRRR